MYFVALILSFFIFISPAKGVDWMKLSLDSLGGYFGCLEVPKDNFNYAKTQLNLEESGKWVATGINVFQGKLIKFDWNTNGVEARPRKYIVMYRIDPRFPKPQIFIKSYDYGKKSYLSDFQTFLNGNLVNYQDKPDFSFKQRIKDYNDYFSFGGGRLPIKIYDGDVINITLIEPSDFFSVGSDSLNNDPSYNNLLLVSTESGGLNNKIIYTKDVSSWCNDLGTSPSRSSMLCKDGLYSNSDFLTSLLEGNPKEPKFLDLTRNIPICDPSVAVESAKNLCTYNQGIGMKISINNEVIKKEMESFSYSSFIQKNFLYYRSNLSGNLNITTDWKIDDMLFDTNQFLSDWSTFLDPSAFNKFVGEMKSQNLGVNFLHFGRYFMLIEIGNGDRTISFDEQNSIKVEYVVRSSTDSSLTSSFSGTEVSKEDRVDADKDGYLWLRIINPNNNVQGTITVDTVNYTGGTGFSDTIYNGVILELRKQIHGFTEIIYTKLVRNPTLQKIVKTMLSLYVMIYGLLFLMGSVKILVSDIVVRVIKISIVLVLIGEDSWNFFNKNLFEVFLHGSDYLMNRVVGMSSSANNIFGFIDPIFERYTNVTTWKLLLIQLFQPHNGLAFFAIMTIYSLLLYLRAVLEVIIGYCIAFLGLAIMISLAPFFISFMLFERTKGMFTSWISTLFSYMIQPTILLIFFLLIDQLIATQLSRTIVKACWGCLIPLKLSLTIPFFNVPVDLFEIPFLKCIPYYISEIVEVKNVHQLFGTDGAIMRLVTSSFLFFAYCQMAHGLVDYVSVVISQLTNVTPARQEGAVQQYDNVTSEIIGDMESVAKPVTGAIKSTMKTLKSKTIDGNYRSRGGGDEDVNYKGKISSGSRNDVKD